MNWFPLEVASPGAVESKVCIDEFTLSSMAIGELSLLALIRVFAFGSLPLETRMG